MRKTLGIAIPTYDKHISYLKDLLDLISGSTVLPEQVSISASSFNGDKPEMGEYPFEVIFTPTSESKNAAQNRNIAASKLTTDIISFIDGDDLPHIKRNEMILKYFETNTLPVVHDYFRESKHELSYTNKEVGELDYEIGIIDYAPKETHHHPFPKNNKLISYHNAHLSLLNEDFKKFKYNEDKSVERKEDSIYNRKLVENGVFISFIKNKLSFYVK
jgi:hypothetical protein